MSKQTVLYEVRVHLVSEFMNPAPEFQIPLQRMESLEQATQYALQVFASSICKLVTVAELVDGDFTENKVSLCR